MRMRSTTEAQTFQHAAAFRLQEQFTIYRLRFDGRCHIHSVLSSFSRVKFCTHSIFSLVACTPREVVRHMTSGFNVCQIDLDMQMSFVNVAPEQFSERLVDSEQNLRNK